MLSRVIGASSAQALGIALMFSSQATAQDGPTPQAASRVEIARTASAPVVTQRPSIDGRLTDAAWTSIAPLTGFLQRELREGEPVTERTEVRVVSDGEALYVAAWMYDRDPGGIVPGEKIRDGALENSDSFALILDTYLDRQNGFVFATTPAGIEYDGQVVKEGEGGGLSIAGQTRAMSGSMGGFNLNWDGTWTVATFRDSLGWYAEFRIPFSTLRYGSGANQRWGVNFVRRIRRKNEDSY
ncbi:MAG: carbohydrate binding family 9 domain-containing protein, partial [Gemmatimonadaceae bacterium]